MKLDHKEIAKGNHNGRQVWVCDYRRPDLSKKPARNVPPTLCEIVDADSVKGRVNYSSIVFLAVKNGKTTSKSIKLYDNTGYRSYTGVPLSVFDNETECTDHWNDQVEAVYEALKAKQSVILDQLQRQIDETLNKII